MAGEAVTEPVDKGVEKVNQASGGVLTGQMDWGDKGGKCYEFWNCSPCCGGYCCVTWWCCGCLNAPKMFAWSLDQDCACINHWVVVNCLPTCCCVRYSIRQKLSIPGGGPMGGLLGDCLCGFCCGACTFCQELRGAHIAGGQDSWDFFGNMSLKPMVSPFKSFQPLMD